MAFAPDGRLFFAEKDTGDIRVIEDGHLLPDPFAHIDVLSAAEQGLLGLALDPAFDTDPWVYVYYSDPVAHINRLARLRTDGGSVERQPLLDALTTENGYHNGGDIVFGRDGKLYLSVGEVHESQRAQDPNDLGGKILRLDPDGTVPSDDPFGAGNPAYSMGHRNSFGLCVDPSNGDLWETENGPSSDDEVNLIRPGGTTAGRISSVREARRRSSTRCSISPTSSCRRGARCGGAISTSARSEPACSTGCRCRRARLPERTSCAPWAPASPTWRWDPTATCTWRRPMRSGGSRAKPEATATVAPAGDSGGGGNTPIAIVAGIVLAAGLAARFIAGRRLRRDVSED